MCSHSAQSKDTGDQCLGDKDGNDGQNALSVILAVIQVATNVEPW